MRAIIQRVISAKCPDAGVDIGKGYFIMLGVARGDTEDSARILADKVSLVRAYQNAEGQWDAHLRDIHGDVLIVPVPDILAKCIRGRRPIYNDVADEQTTKALSRDFAGHFEHLGLRAELLNADMTQIETVLDGPVSFLIDTADL